MTQKCLVKKKREENKKREKDVRHVVSHSLSSVLFWRGGFCSVHCVHTICCQLLACLIAEFFFIMAAVCFVIYP